MHAVGVVVMIIGAIGFALSFASIITVGSLAIWGGVAGVGTVVAVMTRRPSDWPPGCGLQAIPRRRGRAARLSIMTADIAF